MCPKIDDLKVEVYPHDGTKRAQIETKLLLSDAASGKEKLLFLQDFWSFYVLVIDNILHMKYKTKERFSENKLIRYILNNNLMMN